MSLAHTEQFISVALHDVLAGEPLPCTLYVYLDFRFITYRAEGDVLDRPAFDRLEFKKVANLFVLEKDRAKFLQWSGRQQLEIQEAPPLSAETQAFAQAREDAHRKTLDIFQAPHPDQVIAQTLAASKKLVFEVMKFPYSVQTLAQLQGFSRGTVDHSVNVSILSVYLAMQMGYTHALILQQVGAGGLLHDIGKPHVVIEDNAKPESYEAKMLEHADIGWQVMEAQEKVPNEVKTIIAQHHECNDGSGYPKKLRGGAIYDLARIVTIANMFDELVGEGKGSLVERQRFALHQMDQVLYRKFDPQKLEKSLKILKLGV